MKIHVNTDKNIEGKKESLAAYLQSVVENGLNRFSDVITRADIHLSDENGNKEGAADKRCVLEVKAEGIPSVAVTENADTIHKAIDGAVHKMKKALESRLSKAN